MATEGGISFKGVIYAILLGILSFYAIRKAEGLSVLMLLLISFFLQIENYLNYRWLGV